MSDILPWLFVFFDIGFGGMRVASPCGPGNYEIPRQARDDGGPARLGEGGLRGSEKSLPRKNKNYKTKPSFGDYILALSAENLHDVLLLWCMYAH
jgi:hypothetical protein